ncbi:MAG: hypothetical protein OEZ04_02780 [Nitrospinota bacterium]|nr:hypothetical protein [Nitrospinota bacterium]
MGGAAYLIDVTPDHERLVRPSLERELNKKPSFFGRLFGARNAGFAGFVDLPAEELGADILSDFYGWAKAEVKSPSTATTAFLKDYLEPIRADVYLRGERQDPSRLEGFSKWYIQVTFSGCAGLGEVSSMLASHWVEIWYRRNFDRINIEILKPRHLTPGVSEAESAGYGAFFDFAERGPALYYPIGTETEFFLGDREINVNFELDAALEESIQEEGDLKKFHQQVQYIQANLPPELENGQCLCQMCRPPVGAV